jgi:hypothetical protein
LQCYEIGAFTGDFLGDGRCPFSRLGRYDVLVELGYRRDELSQRRCRPERREIRTYVHILSHYANADLIGERGSARACYNCEQAQARSRERRAKEAPQLTTPKPRDCTLTLRAIVKRSFHGSLRVLEDAIVTLP